MLAPWLLRTEGSDAGLAQAQAGDLLFSPSRGRAARRGAGTEIVAGKSVLQAPDGTVRAVLANRDAGVLDFAAVRMAP
ncbi:membrane protein [Bordetella pertussis]|nr:membrane protein [Bordetella pertussis]